MLPHAAPNSQLRMEVLGAHTCVREDVAGGFREGLLWDPKGKRKAGMQSVGQSGPGEGPRPIDLFGQCSYSCVGGKPPTIGGRLVGSQDGWEGQAGDPGVWEP